MIWVGSALSAPMCSVACSGSKTGRESKKYAVMVAQYFTRIESTTPFSNRRR